MLLYTRRAPAKEPKRRSRAGCVQCKEKKKKCNEARPSCDRCLERGLQCEYTPIKPRKRRRAVSQAATSFQCHPEFMRDYAKDEAFRNRLTVFRETPKADLPSFCFLTPGLDFPVEDLETRSALEERHVSNWADARSDSPLSPFDALEPWSGSSSRGLSVDSLRGFLNPRSSSSLSSVSPTPDFCTPVQSSQPSCTLSLQPTSNAIAPASSSLPPLQTESYPELFDHFCQRLAPLLVLNDKYNPYLEYLTPLTAHPVVETALQAVSSAQLENLEVHVQARSLDLHSRALQSLAMSLGSEDPRDEDVPLAATLLLLHYEVVKGSSSTALRSHLNGALSMLQGRTTAKTPTTIFLERAFKYFDVVSALASGRSPLGDSFALPHEPLTLLPTVDPLFGLLEPLWPILHRLAVLVDSKRQIAANSHRRESILQMQNELDEDSRDIELYLLQWKPEVPPTSRGEEPGLASHLESVRSHAEAWRQAALVHLRSAILNQPRSSAEIREPVQRIYQSCLKVKLFSGPSKGLLWPLFVAASQTEESVDMDAARNCFRQLAKERSMNNINVAWDRAEELWKRQSSTGTSQGLTPEVLEEIIAD